MREDGSTILSGSATSITSELQVVSCTLQQLLDTAHTSIPDTSLIGQLTIPEYQRPYVWREKQLNRLLNDLIEYQADDSEDKPLYYLGSIILHQDGNTLKVIDGQQRITTALLIQKLNHPTYKSGVVYNNSISIQNIRHNLAYLKSVFNKEVFDFRDTQVIEQTDLAKINVTLVVTATEDLAYTFFETQNTGGVRLEGSDILKAHHLRAIPSRKMVNYQARKWESIDSNNVEYIVQQLTKIRFWDNRHWRNFPFYKDKKGIKDVLIEEYTVNTKNDNEDISYYYSAVKNEHGRLLQMHESTYKQLKQPLSNGNNTLDYISDYIQLYEILFGEATDHRISDTFFDFRNEVVHGHSGTLFLKELYEIAIIAYVSRFGFYRLFEAALWLYRVIYSLRVSTGRNVREDSVFKFVYDHQLIDNILEVYTVDELFHFLKKFHYNFNTDNADTDKAKGRHLQTLLGYFKGLKFIDYYRVNPKEFDKHLMLEIANRLNGKENGS
ncbi:DUF262 domain-containing protein [Cyclobacterium jeungdonense]|uniref:DUF262 domain-containing protein n=1 Tax=Cyclobacterium jeungdonense TaxID=708087 RepID=A0ABT8CBU5_9BACT|nr:DUF262 domain-containing protein [Cyclobacterium jeungdonense]MDN3689053.1 DUF262 domain-containing protein [Cyclobacterium jeungdonense]